MKHCETFEHTADVGLAASAESLSELFEALAEGLGEVICPRGQVESSQSRPISVEAEDVEALVVDFLAEVLRVIQVEHFCVADVRIADAGPTAVTGELVGESYDPARHELTTEVKAVTYHQLEVRRDDGTWHARVILDI